MFPSERLEVAGHLAAVDHETKPRSTAPYVARYTR